MWPALSPYQNFLDFFFWVHFKSDTFMTQSENLDDLRQRIVDECRQITPNMMNHVRDGFQIRSIEVNGGQFEHLI